MQIKKYIAPSLREAIEKMKAELGEEAIVLSARVLEDGRPTKQFEVVAGIDPVEKRTKSSNNNAAGNNQEQPRERFRTPADKPRTSISVQEKAEPPKPKEPDFQKALDELKLKIYQAKNEKPRPPDSKLPAKMPGDMVKKIPGKQAFMLDALRTDLLDKDIDPTIVATIVEEVGKTAQFLKPADLEATVVSLLASMINVSGFEIKKRKSGKIVALAGPTGVGKTTCIAKLAVISKLLHKLDIGLISLDTYRLGAIDQLKTFAEISEIDFLVAYDEKDLPAMVRKFKNKDVIFLDTAGRSQNNTKLIEETKKALSSVTVDEVILVLSATASTTNLIDSAKKFSVFNYGGIIFTKLDESVAYGNILNTIVKTKASIKYVTNGQVIPDDIIAADPEVIASLIYTGKY